MTAVMLIHRVTQLSEKNIVKAKVCRILSLLWVLYFCFTFSTSVVQYYNQRLYMGNIIRQAESLSGKNQVLKVTGEPDVLKNGYCSQVCMLLIRLLRRMSTTGGMWPLPDIMISREFTGKRQLICRIGYYFL